MPLAWPDLPRLALIPAGPRLSIRIEPGTPGADPGAAADSAWAQMCAENDRLHDGPILAVRSIDGAASTITCARSRYRELALQHHPAVGDRGVRMLGVKGLITGRDRAGREHVLIARRGPQTRIYGGLWELCPGGGVDVPADASTISHDDLARTVVHEAEQEMGVKLAAADCRPPAALVQDDTAFSLDLIVPVAWPGTVDPRRGLCAADGCEWEYLDAAWLALQEVGAFAAANCHAITPPTLAVWRWRGWAAEPVGP